MRAAAFTDLIGPGGIELIERDDPIPRDGEAVVDVQACSINRHDLWILQGDSAMVNEGALPFVSGLDVAGVVRETTQTAHVNEGDRVLLCPNQTCGRCRYCRNGPENRCESFMLFHGGLAESVCVDGSRLVPIPDELSFTAAACLPTAYLTAWHMYRRADVDAGDRVFVPGATGGVGVAAVQLGGVLSLDVVGTTTSSRKGDQLQGLGCDEVIISDDVDELVRKVKDGGEVDATLNHLAGAFTEAAAKVTRRGGRQVVCGRTAGARIETAAAPFFLQHQAIVGSTMGTQPELEKLVALAADGAYEPVVGETYSLAETEAAFRAMAERTAFGKLIIEP